MPDWLTSLFTRKELLSSRDEPEPGPRGFVITLCILTACLLWFAFSMQETFLQVIDMPVKERVCSFCASITIRRPFRYP